MPRLFAAQAVFALVMASSASALLDEAPRVKNAVEAVHECLAYLSERYPQNAPGTDIKWQDKTIFSGGPIDLVTTSKQFTSDTWSIEVSQSMAPLRNIVYQVTVFSPKTGWHWKGQIKADGSVQEESVFRQLSEADRQKLAEEFIQRSRIPPPQGGYGH